MQPSVSPDIVWSPDGKRIAFGSNRTGFLDLYVLAADGSGTETPLLKAIDYMIPTSWSADGRLLLMKSSPITGWDLSVLDLASGAVRTFLATPFSDTAGTFSPDGRVVAYVSNASGRYEVYVRGADGGGERLVSSAGGEGPRWRADGRELFYVSNGRQLMSVPFPEGPSGTPGVPTLLFETRGLTSEIGIAASYDVAPDGRRFIVAVPTEDPPVASLTVVTGWASALRSR